MIRRNFLRALAALLAALPAVASAAGEALPAGRYRCYQPPSYAVTAWFDLAADGSYRFQGEDAARYAYDPDSRRVTWLDGALARDHSGGIYHPPSTEAPTGQRHAIVLERREEAAPAAPSECFLTTH